MSRADPFSRSTGRQILALMCWLAFCFVASATGFFVSTRGWYLALAKPSWNPPAWVFGPVWTVLYVMMSVAAWLVWRKGGWSVQRLPLGLFLVQWLLDTSWTPLFFGMHRSGLAFAEIVQLWVVLAVTVVLFFRVRPLAGVLLVPYLAWVTFAAALNGAIWQLNR